MYTIDSEHKRCFKRAKIFVREELRISRFSITNHKIIRFCHELQNNLNQVKEALQAHAAKMHQIDLKRIEKLPKEYCQPCKSPQLQIPCFRVKHQRPKPPLDSANSQI